MVRSQLRKFAETCLPMAVAMAIVAAGTNRSPAEGIVVPVANRAELIREVQRARPGTRIAVAPGVYQGGLRFVGVQGTAEAPIVLAAADAQHPPVLQGGSTCLQLSDAAYVELRGMVICDATGNGLNIDDGGSYGTPSHHITLRDITVRDIGPQGNHDGIKLSGLDDFVVDSCHVQQWGDGGSAIDMVGCHRGRIVNCQFSYRSDVLANGVQTKGGSANIVIEHCHFERAGNRAVNIGGSTGLPYFRPAKAPYEAKDITVQDNTFVGSMAPIAFVGVDGALVRYNTIYRPTRWVLRILQESRGDSFVPCRNGQFTHNLILFRSDEIHSIANVGAGTAAETFRFAGNHWYCIDRPEQSRRDALPVVEQGGTYGVDPQLRDPEQGDLRPVSTSPARDVGARQ